jgi:hypothetical protein
MAPTSSMSPTRNALSSIAVAQPQPVNSPGALIKCSFAGCSIMVKKQQVLCDTHLRMFGPPVSQRPFASENSINATKPVSVYPNGASLFGTLASKKFVHRKTAGSPPRIPQQPTPKASTPTSRDDSASHSPPPPVSRPSVHSPPISPRSGDQEPPQKKLRLSSASDHVSQTHLNDVAPKRQPAVNAGKEGKATPKLGGRFMRRLPVNRANLRFIDGPETNFAPPPNWLITEKNGSLEAHQRRVSASSELSSVSGLENGSLEREVATPKLAPARIREDDVTGSGQTPEKGLNESSHAAVSDVNTIPIAEPQKTLIAEAHGTPATEANGSTVAEVNRRPVVEVHRPSDPPNGHGPFRSTFTSTQLPEKTLQPSRQSPPAPDDRKFQVPKPKEIDIDLFDALIYSQPGAVSPPPEVKTAAARLPAPPPKPGQPKDEPLYLDIDPRSHWPQPHSKAWHAAKQAEIRARGTRKANFGRAAQSLQKQLKQQEKAVSSFEETLPEKIQENPAWVRMLKRLKGLPVNNQAASTARSVSSRSSVSSGPPGGDAESAPGPGPNVNGTTPVSVGRGVNGNAASETSRGLPVRRSRKSGRVTARRAEYAAGIVVISGLSATQLKSLNS